MTRAQHLSVTLTDILDGDPWYASSLKSILQGVTPVAAAARPLTGAHTIWEIAAHIDSWNRVCLRRLAGEAVLEPDVNFPAPESISPEEWRQLQIRLDASCRELIAGVASLTPAELAATVPGKTDTVDFLIEGVGQHWIYHSGQMALLKRALMDA
jgi:hypothetical protein